MRTQIIAECASNHGGDLALAKEMIRAAAANGADFVKFQVYDTRKLNPSDPQFNWLQQAELGDHALDELRTMADVCHVKLMLTVFDIGSLLRALKYAHHIKIGHGTPDLRWPILVDDAHSFTRYRSVAWGGISSDATDVRLATVPLYPAPLHTLKQIQLLDGYSDHTIGNLAVIWAMAQKVRFIEKHFSLPGKGRNQPWDMDPAALHTIRLIAESFASIHTGVESYERWNFVSRPDWPEVGSPGGGAGAVSTPDSGRPSEGGVDPEPPAQHPGPRHRVQRRKHQ